MKKLSRTAWSLFTYAFNQFTNLKVAIQRNINPLTAAIASNKDLAGLCGQQNIFIWSKVSDPDILQQEAAQILLWRHVTFFFVIS